MEYAKYFLDDLGVVAEVAAFEMGGRGVTEWHVMLHGTSATADYATQWQALQEARSRLTTEVLQGATEHAVRVFCSDIVNQQSAGNLELRNSGIQEFGNSGAQEVQKSRNPEVQKSRTEGAASIVGQPPLDGTKVAMWVYLSSEPSLEHNGYRHLLHTNMAVTRGDSYNQTQTLMEDYTFMLRREGLRLRDGCVRTWFFVRDVDSQYAGMVQARRDIFRREGLTSDTHYIASTGIGGTPADTRSIVQMDAYAVAGLEAGQQRYLYAPTHLNRTSEYGVTFERGTEVQYGDRSHVFISGTASIDNRGEVLHVGDIVGQTNRMLENVEQLLAEAETGMTDVAVAICYLRDMTDHDVVRPLLEARMLGVPLVITWAPVCRPAWLIEMECIAIGQKQSDYRPL